jgi:uncharacterized protein
VPPVSHIAVIVGVSLVASILQRLSGFGFALVATPLAAIVIPVAEVVVVLTMVTLPSTWLTWRQLGPAADRGQVRRLVSWAIPGMAIGVVLHGRIPDKPMRLVLAVVVLSAVIVLASGWRMHSPSTSGIEALAGFVSGLLNTTTGTNGPPLVVLLAGQDTEPNRFRATTSGAFFVSGLVALGLFAVRGYVGHQQLILGAVGLPGALLGQTIGTRAAPLLREHIFRRMTYALLVGAALSSAVVALR